MPYSPDWEKELMDKFCVMFERAHRDDAESGDAWVTKMEDFIRSVLQAREEWLRGFLTAEEAFASLQIEEEEKKSPKDAELIEYLIGKRNAFKDVLTVLTP